MERPGRNAFTLVELLVAVCIICILLAILMPFGGAAWAAANQMQCKSRLGNIYKAQQAYQAQQTMAVNPDATSFATGPGWQELLRPFLEQAGAFTCPESSVTWSSGSVDRPPNTAPAKLEFKFYLRNRVDGFPIDAAYSVGDFLWSIPIPNDAGWVRTIPAGDHLRVQVDDCPSQGVYTYDDFWLDLYMDGATPTKVVKANSGHGLGSPGSLFRYTADLVVGSKVLVHDWAHAADGLTIEVPAEVRGWADYGLSKGIYERPDNLDICRIDSKLILALDYPLSIADYNQVGTDDEWARYFVQDVTAWRQAYKHSETDLDWQWYDALRHGGRANVLFCDGRVDTLGPEDLYQTNPLWFYQGL
jgi:prepilin-type processing-associated H-X9-DG protein/prepilin-type N-terminal cleavage/methylation domain-containing protein